MCTSNNASWVELFDVRGRHDTAHYNSTIIDVDKVLWHGQYSSRGQQKLARSTIMRFSRPPSKVYRGT
jgi:hypothetical protein